MNTRYHFMLSIRENAGWHSFSPSIKKHCICSYIFDVLCTFLVPGSHSLDPFRGAQAAVQSPAESALLLSLAGVRSVLANQWFTTLRDNAERLDVLAESGCSRFSSLACVISDSSACALVGCPCPPVPHLSSSSAPREFCGGFRGRWLLPEPPRSTAACLEQPQRARVRSGRDLCGEERCPRTWQSVVPKTVGETEAGDNSGLQRHRTKSVKESVFVSSEMGGHQAVWLMLSYFSKLSLKTNSN